MNIIFIIKFTVRCIKNYFVLILTKKLELIFTEAYKGHCVLCKDVLSFVFQTFDFQVLCFGFCALCLVLLINGTMET